MSGFILKLEDFKRVISNWEYRSWYLLLSKVLPEADINTPNRVAGFISQCAVESGDFKTLEENLNYSEKALKRTFGRYFKDRDAAEYARNPEKIANYVYMDKYRTKRGALGNVYEGDGWKFRGRGIIQLTGRANYERFAKTVNMTAEEAAEYLETKEGALISALWFWRTNNLNRFCDRGDIEGLSKAVNGGRHGLKQRISVWNSVLSVLGQSKVVSSHKELNVGDRGDNVKEMQRHLGVTADGIFGPNTRRAVKKFQRENGFRADGIASPEMLEKLYS